MMDNCTLQNFDLRMFLCNIDHKEISKERGNVDHILCKISFSITIVSFPI